jgi:hypothetical protein
MKACENCTRVEIGKNHNQTPVWKRAIGMILVYIPILTLPFVILSAYLTYYHLLFVGAKNLKTWGDYIPDRASYRYNYQNQITMKPSFRGALSKYKWFWVANCSWYCPYSVALFEWHAYLVKIVENWWCPFGHDKKETYNNAPIDKSFWHIYPDDAAKLDERDLNNPIWNEDNDKQSES